MFKKISISSGKTSENNLAKIAINKSLLKENINNGERTVFMQDKTEYQIQLFNSKHNTIGAEIWLDGKKMDNVIVLKPGERVWLERYLNENRKFLFETYFVEDNNPDVENAIANNGEVVVKFYNEREIDYNNLIVSNLNPYKWEKCNFWKNNNNIYCSTTETIKYYNQPTALYSNSGNLNCKATNTAASTIDSYQSAATTVDHSNADFSNIKETGRTGKGNYSDQSLNVVNVDFEYYPFKTETIKILPYSQKPFYKKDVEKVYCTECGTKLSPKFKYCPKCGTKI